MTASATWLSLVGDHLWQSTLFAGGIWLLVLACRGHRARVRYRLWLAASIKFVLPFACLTVLGEHLSWNGPLERPIEAFDVIEAISHPFSHSDVHVVPPSVPADSGSALDVARVIPWVWGAGAAAVLGLWGLRWRRVSALVAAALPAVEGREYEILRRLERAQAVRTPVPLRMSDSLLEPSVFGIVRPALIWPRGISAHLTDAQVAAALSHELCHVQRRDNLVAVVHTLIESVFWFHPVVWWLGTRLVEERERACDEDVLQRGWEPQVYAETILKTCEYCVAPATRWAAGVTGSDLRKRIEDIMANRSGKNLSFVERLALTTALTGMVAIPLYAGMVRAQPAPQARTGTEPRPKFEAASVRENRSGDAGATLQLPRGRFVATNMRLKPVIAAAYGFPVFRVSGGPSWVESARFDIQATAGNVEQPLPPGPPSGEIFVMLQDLLEERFQLVVREVTQEQPIYRLVLARSDGRLGPRLRPSTLDCEQPRAGAGGAPPGPPAAGEMPDVCGNWGAPDRYTAGAATLAQLSGVLSNRVSRFVVDETGLDGLFDLNLEYTPDPMTQTTPVGGANAPPATPDVPSIFTALQEQLGLRLVGGRGPVPVLVIERVEKPKED